MSKYKTGMDVANSEDDFRLIPRLHRLITQLEKVDDLLDHHRKQLTPLLKVVDTEAVSSSVSDIPEKYSLCEAFDLLESLEYKIVRIQNNLIEVNQRVLI